ncbi:MAG: Gfo/Idh/MocA family protein [Planctomycetota bacterium]|jgi:predicted dehydrogenase
MERTRREFLKASAAIPFILPSTLSAAGTSANGQLRIGMIGMGTQANGLTNSFMPRAHIVAVCDVDTTRREHFLNKVNEFYTNYPQSGKAECKAYVNYEDVIARDDIDSVCIATPDHWHTQIVLDAVRSGKDVYCEKPLTHDIAEAIEVMKVVGENRRILQTGSMQRSMREFRVAAELVRNGVIGKLKRVVVSFWGPGIPCDLLEEPMEPGLDWNRWLGPAPIRPYHSALSPRGVHEHFPAWRMYREYGGGGVADWAPHHLDIAHWAMKMDNSGPTEILPPEDKNASFGTRLLYPNGVEVEHKDGNGLEFFGTDGYLYVNRGTINLELGGKTVAKFLSREDGGTLNHKLSFIEEEYLKDAKVHLYKVNDSHTDDFMRCVKSRTKPVAHEMIGGHTVIATHLMNLAYYHRQAMKWNPKKYTFADGTGDVKWLTGSRRDYKKAVL